VQQPEIEEGRLFEPATTIPPKCVCGATKKNICNHDADIDKGWIPTWATRPPSCLNRHDPANGDIPY
jgi:hypothetical protein